MLLSGSVNLANIIVGLVRLYGSGEVFGSKLFRTKLFFFFLKKRIVSRAPVLTAKLEARGNKSDLLHGLGKCELISLSDL